MIYQHPLAYLLGLEGIALLRAFSGVYEHDFTTTRLREVQQLLDSAEELGEGVEALNGLRTTTSRGTNSSISSSRSCVKSSTASRWALLLTPPAEPVATPRTSHRSDIR